MQPRHYPTKALAQIATDACNPLTVGWEPNSWYALQTNARAEKKTVASLARKAIPTFLPRLLVSRRHGSRRWQCLEAMFPGYIFARFAPDPHTLHAVRWTPGVKRVLGDETAPIPVPDDVVDFLQQRVGERGYLLPCPHLAAGTRVRFVYGPFAYLEGVIERPPSHAARVRVLLTLLNMQAPVDVAVDELEPV